MKQCLKISKESLDLIKIEVPIGENKILEKVSSLVNSDNEIKSLWKIINVNATARL